MVSIQTKRILLFLFGCILVRSLFVVISYKLDLNYLPYLGYLALLPAIGFLYIYFTGARKVGPETFGKKIWWNDLRPVHAILYFLFSYNAIQKNKNSYKFLLADVILGLTAFTIYHTFLYKSE